MTAAETYFEARPERMPLGKLLSWTGQCLGRYYQRTVSAHGLTSTSIGVLGVLAHRDGLSHRELAGRLGVTPATLTPVVDVLEDAGELRRDRDRADRRIVRLFITQAGRDRLVTAFAEVAATFRDRMPHPPPEEELVIRRYLLGVLAAVTEGECDETETRGDQ
ncbi:MarR family winged helix-turn-helix transcriptional regulator [Pseudonocardia sp. H11422]|uniref:MarR family winged helix-turn-helix transcriptional regulator n=1 Tax=Pseudonocardia sp. H11422 TaxID=2835866 RepID=UPI001BDCFB91|nr:MarR family winged helix-turn-helix transcriptional regulator [Pseudonocardia sp. H11422]